MDFLRPQQERRYSLVIQDPHPVENVDAVWTMAAQASVIGLFSVALIVALSLGRAILLPVMAALVIGTTLSPLVRAAGRRGISPAVTALLLTLALIAVVGIGATLLAQPVSEWIARAPEIGARIRDKLYVLERPLAALHDLQRSLSASTPSTPIQVEQGRVEAVAPVLAFVTPALAQVLVFFGTLVFYLVGQQEIRRRVVMLFSDREAKLRFLRITNDIEHNLTGYLAVVTVINSVLGLVVGLGAWAFGLPNPAIFGMVTFILNYLPYLGPTIMVVTLLGVGMVTFPTLGQALLPPVTFVLVTTLEGQFITPTIVGRRLTLNPLMVFLALAFWTWLWGPIGAFLAVPLCIVGLVTLNHLLPTEEAKLPD